MGYRARSSVPAICPSVRPCVRLTERLDLGLPERVTDLIVISILILRTLYQSVSGCLFRTLVATRLGAYVQLSALW